VIESSVSFVRGMSWAAAVTSLLLAQATWKCDGANWAQTTGKLEQNVVIPRMPTPAYRHWAQRYGHAVVVASNNSETTKGSSIYLFGGDTFEGDPSGENVCFIRLSVP
jgi:hypothetical protein